MINSKRVSIITFFTFVVLFCAYIFPLGLLDPTYIMSKLIFISALLLLYLVNIKKLFFREILFLLLIFIIFVYTKNVNYLLFISLPFLDKFISYKEQVSEYLLKSNILYICLFFTLFYTLIFFGEDGRYVFSAIKEVNQSGLAIFCLGTMLLKKNKKVGIFTLIFGLFTLSRSYAIAVFLLVVSNSGIVKRILRSGRIVKIFNYNVLTILSSVLLIGLGAFYVMQYKMGNIYYSGNLTGKFSNLLDYSNFFRFSAILNILYVYKCMPSKLLTGISNAEYLSYSSMLGSKLSIPSSSIVPHNLFFSHLKIYGVISIFETLYLSRILSKIVNKKNFVCYIAICLYSFILGAGLYNYWLYLSVFVFFVLDSKSAIDVGEQSV